MPKIINATAPDGDNFTLSGQSLNDVLMAGNGIQSLYGNAGDDCLVGGAGDQKLYGGSGTDYVVAGMGNQTLDGGSGYDTADFSRLVGRLDIDPDLHTAKLLDLNSGAVIYTYSITSFDVIKGTDYGNDFRAAAYTPRSYIGGAGSDHYFSESGGDVVTGGAGADIFGWMKKYVAVGHVDEIADFEVGVDHLDLRDFLKGQLVKAPAYTDVVRLVDTVDHAGHAATLVQTMGAGLWHDTVVLDGIVASTISVYDLKL